MLKLRFRKANRRCFINSLVYFFNIPTVPGKVIILHKSISCPNGGQTHAERQEKKSISLINLTHFAILHSLL